MLHVLQHFDEAFGFIATKVPESKSIGGGGDHAQPVEKTFIEGGKASY